MGAAGPAALLLLPAGYAGFELARKGATLLAHGVSEEHHPAVINLQPGESVTVGDTTITVPKG